MSTAVELLTPQKVWTPPVVKSLDEAVWEAWLAKGHEQDQRRSATFMKGVKWVSIAGILLSNLNVASVSKCAVLSVSALLLHSPAQRADGFVSHVGAQPGAGGRICNLERKCVRWNFRQSLVSISRAVSGDAVQRLHQRDPRCTAAVCPRNS